MLLSLITWLPAVHQSYSEWFYQQPQPFLRTERQHPLQHARPADTVVKFVFCLHVRENKLTSFHVHHDAPQTQALKVMVPPLLFHQ